MEMMKEEKLVFDLVDNVIRDVTLVGSDGGRIWATKAVLAVRSPVFCRIFRESSKNDCECVQLDYPAPVLRAIVAYCYTNEARLERWVCFRGDGTCYVWSDASAVALVQVLDAAKYLELSELVQATLDSFREHTWLCTCAILQELLVRGWKGEKFWLTCMAHVKTEPIQCLPGIVQASSLLLLETLWESLREKLSPDLTAEVLQLWYEAHGSLISEEERSRLQKLADTIDLQSMGIRKLSKLQPCPLFSSQVRLLVHKKTRRFGTNVAGLRRSTRKRALRSSR